MSIWVVANRTINPIALGCRSVYVQHEAHSPLCIFPPYIPIKEGKMSVEWRCTFCLYVLEGQRGKVHGGFQFHEAQPVIVYAIRNQQFTIKRNIYELTRTNFIIWILVKTRLPHSNSNSHSILVIWQQISLGCHNFRCSFDALHCFFCHVVVVFVYLIYIKCIFLGIL